MSSNCCICWECRNSLQSHQTNILAVQQGLTVEIYLILSKQHLLHFWLSISFLSTTALSVQPISTYYLYNLLLQISLVVSPYACNVCLASPCDCICMHMYFLSNKKGMQHVNCYNNCINFQHQKFSSRLLAECTQISKFPNMVRGSHKWDAIFYIQLKTLHAR